MLLHANEHNELAIFNMAPCGWEPWTRITPIVHSLLLHENVHNDPLLYSLSFALYLQHVVWGGCKMLHMILSLFDYDYGVIQVASWFQVMRCPEILSFFIIHITILLSYTSNVYEGRMAMVWKGDDYNIGK